MKARYSNLERCYGEKVVRRIAEAKVLVIGAGGIGCELLKDLVCSGFLKITVLDLDTVDVSNLNRQFLFNRKSVGKSKALSAREAILKMQPDAEILAYHDNIKEAKYNLSFFSSFDLVFNALDNVSARQHVNRLCMASKAALIDGGSMGYLGQVGVMLKNETKCYDCDLKVEKKESFAICTIRNTPDKMVHCVVWAKEVVKLLFGDFRDSMLADLSVEETEQNAEIEILSMIVKNTKRLDSNDPSQVEKYIKSVFDTLFHEEINLKLAMKDGYKGSKCVPAPLPKYTSLHPPPEAADPDFTDDATLRAEFGKAVKILYRDRFDHVQSGQVVFDKDDEPLMQFVCALANLRATVFSIKKQSLFEIKGIAGNIIHAIAATNAAVAAIQVSQGIRILENEGKVSECKFSWILREKSGSGCLIQPQKLEKPKEGCYTCGNATAKISIDTKKRKLKDLVNTLRDTMGINQPNLMKDASEIYMCGDGLDEEEIDFFEANLEKPLIECPAGGIGNECMLNIEDFSQELNFSLVVLHHDNDEITVGGETVTPPKPVKRSIDAVQDTENHDKKKQKSSDMTILSSEGVEDVLEVL